MTKKQHHRQGLTNYLNQIKLPEHAKENILFYFDLAYQVGRIDMIKHINEELNGQI